ncbi:cytochrome c oxidase assembly protein subunit 15 [Noviherbaspirillum humi]|uniref:Cytochrome c oxidase assembly protein subunit 15 n=1 Tax=Noviherbaspirillum humi TaxID=1688639 RepID=A0A239CJR7_9BURK|nr:COX15/CtaA family protein [Noviherbaspirillum humi]SNS19941.1 cytochrome c oxidase assembly protein subunit 15 [Noviherbaspirillum humi]
MLIQLAIMGLLAACLPLSVVWVSNDANKYRKLAWVTVFLTFDLVMFGAFTRLTDSGLGCPDWPGCYGHANPLQAHEHISAAEAAMPTGPVTVAKAWIEMIHRYFAMAVGVLIIAMVVIAWRNWRRNRRTPTAEGSGGLAMPLLLFFFVCLQGAFGAWTVTLKLQPVIVTLHLLLGLTLLGLLAWHAARLSRHAPVGQAAAGLKLAAGAGLLLLALQIALGGWVSTNYAALACADFPLCQGTVVPPMDYQHGFTLWRELGKTGAGDYLPFAALTAIHWTHRNFAFVVFAVVGWLAWRAGRVPGLERTARWLGLALALQLITGLSTIFLNWPLAIAVAHNGGAALLLLLLTMLNFKIRLAGRPVSTLSCHAQAAARSIHLPESN